MIGCRGGIAAGLLIAVGVGVFGPASAATDAPASATTAYDGVWSVVISSKDGLCSGAHRYPIAIVNGSVRRADRSNQAVNVRGKVEADGRVSVNVGSGDLRAHGVGRLAQSTGGGTWRSSTGCTGRWQATRRA